MGENPYLKSKMNRLRFMFNFIKTKSPVDYKEIVAIMEWNFGLSKRTIKDYIKTLNDLESIEIKRGKISLKKKEWFDAYDDVWGRETSELLGYEETTS